MSRLVAVAVVCGLVAAISPPLCAGTRNRIEADKISADLIAGRSFLLEDRTLIHGSLELRGQTVRGALVCKKCTVSGGIHAAQARFEQLVDLGGATVKGEVNLENATFLAAVRFGSAGRTSPQAPLSFKCLPEDHRAGALFKQKVNLTFATFEDIADFQQVTFCDEADFASARFRDGARFGRVDFRSDSRFSAASFDREAVFADGNFAGPTIDFRAAVFGRAADFRRARLGGVTSDGNARITFEGGVFRERADFGHANFVYPTNFRDLRLAGDGVFRNAEFHRTETAKPDAVVVTFDEAEIEGLLDFTHANLEGVTQLRWVTAGALSTSHKAECSVPSAR